MREDVSQMWTPAWLVLTVLLLAGAVWAARYREGTAEAREEVESALYCAAPTVQMVRRVPDGRAARPGSAAAMLLVLMTQHGRLGVR